MRLDPVTALVHQSSDQVSVYHITFLSEVTRSWEACKPDSEGCFPLYFIIDIKYLPSDTCRNPVRIWRNDYQSLLSVRGKWFWACVRTVLGSWWQVGISGSCSCLSRGCKACAGSAASSLLLCHPRHPAASHVAQSQGLCDSWPHITTASSAVGWCCCGGIGEMPPCLLACGFLTVTHLHRGLWCTVSTYQLIYYYCWATSAFEWESCSVGLFFLIMWRASRGSVMT